MQNFYYSGYYTIDTVDYGYTDILTHIIHGNIKQSNNNALKNSWVYLLIYDSLDATLRVSDSMKTDTMGNYSFLTNDSILYVYATPDSALYPNEMPTYYDTAIVFPDSRRVVMTADRTVNFKTKAGANPGGAGEIHGIISLCSACKKGGPAIHVKIILTDKNNVPQAYTYTDASGNFSFGKLELKTYKVWVDQVGIKNSLAPSVDLSSSVTKLGQNFTLYPDHLEKDIMNGIAETVQSKTGIKIYPQPAEDKLFMELPGNVRMQICITDIFGRELMHFYSYTEGLDISSLTSGMYILKYTDASNNASVAKFSKK